MSVEKEHKLVTLNNFYKFGLLILSSFMYALFSFLLIPFYMLNYNPLTLDSKFSEDSSLRNAVMKDEYSSDFSNCINIGGDNALYFLFVIYFIMLCGHSYLLL